VKLKLPTLYKKTQSGDPQEWTIEVEGSTILTHWGRVGGKIQHGSDTINEGKNTGRANATTPQQQAESEARSQWEFKKKKGYVEEQSQAMAGKVDKIIEGGIFPMLAHTHRDHKKKLEYPAFAQPKLDGHRCIAICKDGKVTLWSRSRKRINSVPHIVAALEERITEGNFMLDGELYNHDYHDNFEELTHFIRQKTPIKGHTVLQYHIYDMPVELDYDWRLAKLREFFQDHDCSHTPLKLVETVDVLNEKHMHDAYEHFMDQGYEGAIVRNAAGNYEQNRRSYNLLKVKEFQDDEFKIVDVIEGRGKLAGHGIFICETASHETFKAKLKGDTDNLIQYWDKPKLAIGRMLTVQFQGYTKYGMPRFPVGLRFRKDI
jgi:DNA ligase-1